VRSTWVEEKGKKTAFIRPAIPASGAAWRWGGPQWEGGELLGAGKLVAAWGQSASRGERDNVSVREGEDGSAQPTCCRRLLTAEMCSKEKHCGAGSTTLFWVGEGSLSEGKGRENAL